MDCTGCSNEENLVCKIYNTPIEQFDMMQYCPHKKVTERDEEWHNKMMLPSKPIRR